MSDRFECQGITVSGSMRHARDLRRLFLTLSCFVLCLNCGSVGEPLPPLLNIPERSQDLQARQIVDSIVLDWTWPPATTEGRPLKDLARFLVHAMVIAAPDQIPTPETFERESKLAAALEGPALERYSAGEKVELMLPSENMIGKTLVLGVRGESSRGRSSGFSNLAILQVIEPPPRPERPVAMVEPTAIVIDWQPTERAQSYRVLQSSESAGPFEEIGRTQAPPLRHPDFQMNQNYYYRVGGIARSATGAVQGPLSEIGQVFTKDTFPPATPGDLRAVATKSSVELSWQPNPELDLAGYRVRRAEDSAPPVLLNPELLKAPSLTDSRIEPNRTYTYTVSAVDHDSNESAPSEPFSVAVGSQGAK